MFSHSSTHTNILQIKLTFKLTFLTQIIGRMWLTDKNRPKTAEEKRKVTIMRAIRAWNEISPDIGSHHSKKQFQRYFMFKFLFCMV